MLFAGSGHDAGLTGAEQHGTHLRPDLCVREELRARWGAVVVAGRVSRQPGPLAGGSSTPLPPRLAHQVGLRMVTGAVCLRTWEAARVSEMSNDPQGEQLTFQRQRPTPMRLALISLRRLASTRRVVLYAADGI